MASSSSSSTTSSVTDRFEDFDTDQAFRKAKEHAKERSSCNFVVEFGSKKARIAFDLNSSEIKELLGKRDTENYPIRWINIWDPSQESGEVVAGIGEHYEFSERLVGLMQAGPRQPTSSGRRSTTLSRRRSTTRNRTSPGDLESGQNGSMCAPGSYRMTTTARREEEPTTMGDESMDVYMQVKNAVNYCSTDQTPKALCIGAHWLHKRPTRAMQRPSTPIRLPKHWQWLTLCDDHTALSIHEQPVYEAPPEGMDRREWEAEAEEREAQERESMRSNTLDVLLQLSKKGFDLYKEKPLSLNSIRRPLSKWDISAPNHDQQATNTPVNNQPSNLADEGTSNLFYYLFEDYVAAGPLKAAESILDQMTGKVFDSTRPTIRKRSVDIIHTLHYLSKDLRELRNLVENYKNIISKITALGRPDAQSHSSLVTDARKVMLTKTAVNRFERLGDRLQYLMMNSIQGYLEEISALSSTYFNLTQQKDSEATARLTRSATLLAKLSVFFLPISFLTSYFSIQIEDLYKYWHGTDYWYSFAVIASVSFVSLFFFSRLLMFFSDMLDEWSSRLIDWCRDLVGWENEGA